jgi:hypothetical protein
MTGNAELVALLQAMGLWEHGPLDGHPIRVHAIEGDHYIDRDRWRELNHWQALLDTANRALRADYRSRV